MSIRIFQTWILVNVIYFASSGRLEKPVNDVNDNLINDKGSSDHEEAAEEELPELAATGTRAKRETDAEELGLDSVSFEVPTVVRLNDPSPFDMENQANQVDGSSYCCGPQDQLNNTKVPKITVMVENVLTREKADLCQPTARARRDGTGVVVEVSLKGCAIGPVYYQAPSCCLPPKNSAEKAKAAPRSETEEDDEDDDEEGAEADGGRPLQEVLKTLLSSGLVDQGAPGGGKTDHVTQSPVHGTTTPITLVLSHNILQRLSHKLLKPTSGTAAPKRPAPPEYDQVLKLLEQVTANVPKSKLISLLSSVVSAVPQKREAQGDDSPDNQF